MAHKGSLLAGMAIGAGAALGIREIVRRVRNSGQLAAYGDAEHMLEPEDSWTPTYVPNAPEEHDHWFRATDTTGQRMAAD